MSYIAIRCTYDDFDLRRDLMLFDRLALPFLETSLSTWRMDGAGEELLRRAAELEWLANKDVVFMPPLNSLESGPGADYYLEYIRLKNEYQLVLSKLTEYARSNKLALTNHNDLEKVLIAYVKDTGNNILQLGDEISRVSYDNLSRAFAVDLSKNLGAIALPIMSSKSHTDSINTFDRADVLNIAFNAVPFPASSTSLESLLDFRNDPDVRADFLAFHRWVAGTAMKNTKPAEIIEEVEYLLAQYQRHMKIHKIEQGASTFETIVTVTAEILEDLLKFKWGNVAKLMFAFRKRQVGLLKAELNAPGKEVAYLVKAGSKAQEA